MRPVYRALVLSTPTTPPSGLGYTLWSIPRTALFAIQLKDLRAVPVAVHAVYSEVVMPSKISGMNTKDLMCLRFGYKPNDP